jgi:ubiquinone/menaquinone biosynthesis C-methylase UbiE
MTDDITFKREDAASYDNVADDFDTLTSRYTAPLARRIIRAAALVPGQRVLDVGCGTGVLTQLAAQAVQAHGHVVGFDLSDGMLAKATALVTEAGLGARVAFIKGDAEQMPFPDASFDAVVSLYALLHFPNPDKALVEMHRCSAPGATTLVAAGSAPPMFSLAFLEAVGRIGVEAMLRLSGRAPLRATDFLDGLVERQFGPAARAHDVAAHSGHRTHGSIRAMMQRVGYRNLRSSWVGQSTVIASPQDFWTLQVTLSTRSRKRLQAATPQQVDALRALFDRLCAEHLARGGRLIYRSGALVVTGVRA